MKKIPLLLAVMLLFTTALFSQEVGTDHELDANLKSYKTYSWSKDIDQIPTDQVFIGPNGVMVYNNESTRSKIKEAIQYELSAKGYKMVEQNPDFLVSFVVLEQPAEIITYNGYRLLNAGMDTVRTAENVNQTTVQAGTVMINFIDFKTARQVWQGYASGVLNANIINSDAEVRSAIGSIFDRYRFDALANKN